MAHEFDALSFLALLSCHIPLRGESLTRYFGRYSCRARGERKKQELLKNPAPESDTLSEALEPRGRPSVGWAEGLKRIYEFDPLECPKCKSPMRIIAFIHDPHELENIMRSMGIPKAQSPPPIPKAPSANEYEYAQEFAPESFGSEFEYL